MSRLFGFVLGFVLIAAPVAAWLARTDRLPFPVASMIVASQAPAPAPEEQAAAPAGQDPVAADDALPEPRIPEPEETSDPVSATADEADPPAPPADTGSPPQPDPGPDPGPEPDPAFPAAPEAVPAPAEAVVWQAFRSQRAAEGFAGHLAGRYGVDTSVRRDGPGRYRVLVVADSDSALASQLQRLRAETGLARLEVTP